MTVDFATYCCYKDKDKLMPVLVDHVKSHSYDFDSVNVIFQRTNIILGEYNSYHIDNRDYNSILLSNGINPYNKEADEYTHGYNAAHYWKHHCVNHLKALNESTADYIVLADADCYMKTNTNWVEKGIQLLKSNPKYLVISPSDGTKVAHETNIMSQQLFLCERKRMLGIDFDLPFTGFKEGGPFAEFYFLLEGRISRYMEKHGLTRFMLSDEHRYWHDQWMVLLALNVLYLL